MVSLQRAQLGSDGQFQFRNPSLEQLLNVPASESSVRVTSSSVFGIPAFTQAVRLISTAVARCNAFPYKKDADGGRTIDEASPAFPLLTRKANAWQTYYNFRQTIVANAIWSGDGYGYIERDPLANPVALYNLDSRQTYPIVELTDGRISNLFYGVNTSQGQVVLQSDDVVHIKNISLHTGTEGLSLVDSLRTVLGLSLAVQKWGALYFKNGSHISRVLKIPGWLSKEKQLELRESLTDLHQGLSNSHRLAVLMGGSELQTFPTTNEEAQFISSRQFSLIDVANAVGISATFLNSGTSSSFASLIQESLNFLNLTLDAWLTQIEVEFTCKLIKARDQDKFIEFDRSSLFASDPSYIDSAMRMYQSEAISWEELRQRLRLSTKRTGQFIRPANLIDADEEPEQEKPEPQPQPQPEPEQEADDIKRKAERLTEAALDRLKQRLAKAVKTDPDLSKHSDIIRSALMGLDAEQVIAELDTFQEELYEVLPEQRGEVIARWNIEETSQALWA